jgi:hypothetical protein
MSQRYIGGLIYNPPGGFSGYFDGNGDYLSLASNAAFAMGTGDFTVEGFLYLPTTQNFGTLFLSSTTGSGDSLHVQISSANKVRVTNATTEFLLGTNAIPLNTWSHIAVVRSGTTLSIYQDGVLNGSTTNSTNFIQSGALVGYEPFGGNFYFTGYISNVRVLKGTALYSGSTYTVPSGPLQAITNTSLLTCAYPTFRDGSSNNFTITVNGNTAVSVQNPFPLTALPNPNLGNQGNGVYTMSQYQSLRSQNLWPAVDPYWEYVTLMLHGNGTNGAQNNTFLDSSTNNFTITRNGNTTQGAFSPYGDNWSNYFDGTGDYLNLGGQSAFSFGTGDFTIEFWVYLNSTTANLSDFRQASTNGLYPAIYVTNGSLRYYVNSLDRITSSTTLAVGTWYHVALSRSGTSTRLFLNGVQEGSTYTDSNNYIVGPDRPTIGISGFDGTGNPLNGYLSNYRIVKGTAVYTSNFTPPTAPLTAITNTSLLTCQSNRFRDASTNNFTITRNGDVSVQRFSPFNPTAPYAAGTDGGSGYFDGTGDYLTVADNAAFQLGSGAFTIEAFFYSTSSGDQVIISKWGSPDSNAAWEIIYYAGTLYCQVSSGSTVTSLTTTTFPLNQWNHVVMVRSGNTLSAYLNGTRFATNGAYSSTVNNGSNGVSIGTRAGGSSFPMVGYISNARVVKGTAVYDPTQSTLTIPTAPLTAVTNTSLLCNFTNAGILDNAMMNDLETVGNAQISTSVSKFGGGSLAFDGSGDYLSSPQSQNYSFGTGDFTIEGWIYLSSNTGAYRTIVHIPHSSGSVLVRFGSSIDYSSYFQVSTLATSASNVYSTNQNQAALLNKWVHFAFTRSSSTCRVFLDGVQQNLGTGVTPTSFPNTSFSDSTNIVNNSAVGIGDAIGNNIPFIGHIDDLRITKGYARYTANFTPQRSQWQDQ